MPFIHIWYDNGIERIVILWVCDTIHFHIGNYEENSFKFKCVYQYWMTLSNIYTLLIRSCFTKLTECYKPTNFSFHQKLKWTRIQRKTRMENQVKLLITLAYNFLKPFQSLDNENVRNNRMFNVGILGSCHNHKPHKNYHYINLKPPTTRNF